MPANCQLRELAALVQGGLTPGPYCDWPFSSLLCRTLWKSYLFNWRTKLAKLLCLKCFGRMCLVNFSFYATISIAHMSVKARRHTSSTTKLSPSFPHLTTLSSLGFSSILARVLVSTGCAHVVSTYLYSLRTCNVNQHMVQRSFATANVQSRWSCSSRSLRQNLSPWWLVLRAERSLVEV